MCHSFQSVVGEYSWLILSNRNGVKTNMFYANSKNERELGFVCPCLLSHLCPIAINHELFWKNDQTFFFKQLMFFVTYKWIIQTKTLNNAQFRNIKRSLTEVCGNGKIHQNWGLYQVLSTKSSNKYVFIIVNTLVSEYIIWISKYELKLSTEKHWTNLYMVNV